MLADRNNPINEFYLHQVPFKTCTFLRIEFNSDFFVLFFIKFVLESLCKNLSLETHSFHITRRTPSL